ncbi:MAG: DUF3488 domain-containing protein [Elusimicrobia bacterium]|nr:DUF3488 domain-containing protein [Elusimicrobiota bacterium]
MTLTERFHRAVWLFAGISGVSLVATRELHPMVSAVALGAFPLGWWLNRRPVLPLALRSGHSTRPVALPALPAWIKRWEQRLLILIVAGALADWIWIHGMFLLMLGHFLLAFQSLKVLSLKEHRDFFQMFILAALQLFSAATLAIDWWFLAGFLLALPTAARVLMLYQLSGHVGSQPEGAPLVISVHRSAAFTVGVVLTFGALVFLIFPRLTGMGLPIGLAPLTRRAGYTDHVVLPSGGRILDDPSIIMRVEITPPEARQFWNGYLRATTLDFFDGTSWSDTQSARQSMGRDLLGRFMVLAGQPPRTLFEQTIFLEPLDAPVLFAAPWVWWVRTDRPVLFVKPDLTISRTPTDHRRIRYHVGSYIFPPSERELRQAPWPSTTRPIAQYLQLPSEGIASVRTLAHQLTDRLPTPYEKVRVLEQYLRTNFRYTTDLGGRPGYPPLSARQPLEWFLFERKAGHCEYFASALCVMLRSLGVPSRVATGFVRGEWNPTGRYYLVRAHDAHAWVEAYFEGVGWVQVDPSPRVLAREPASRGAWKALQDLTDYLNLLWNRYILTYDLERQVSLARGIQFRSQVLSFRIEESVGSWLRRFRGMASGAQTRSIAVAWYGWTLGLVLIGVFSWWCVQLSHRLLGGRIRGSSDRSARAAVWFYEDLLRRLRRMGYQKRPSQTPHEFAAAVSEAIKTHTEVIRLLTAWYYQVRYGGVPLTPDQHATARDVVALIHVRD